MFSQFGSLSQEFQTPAAATNVEVDDQGRYAATREDGNPIPAADTLPQNL